MKKVIALFFLLAASQPCFGEIYSTKEETLSEISQYSGSIEVKKITLTTRQKNAIENKLGRRFPEKNLIFYIGKTEEKINSYSLILDELGKHGPITFIVTINNEGRVKKLSVLKSVELKGAKIKRKRFLRQFKGKGIKDPIKLRKDIDAISGATVSSNAAIRAVRKALIIWEELFLEV